MPAALGLRSSERPHRGRHRDWYRYQGNLDYVRQQEERQPLEPGHNLNPERLYEKRWAEAVLAQVLDQPQIRSLLSSEHFSVNDAERLAVLAMLDRLPTGGPLTSTGRPRLRQPRHRPASA